MDHPMDPGGVFLMAIAIWKCWNENSGGRNALDLMHDSKRVCGLPIYGGAILKQLAITRQTLKDLSNKYTSLCFSYPDLR